MRGTRQRASASYLAPADETATGASFEGSDRQVGRPATASVSLPVVEIPRTGREPPAHRQPVDVAGYKEFRRICDQLVAELKRADDFLEGGLMTDEGAEVVVEVEHLLERLYDCPWGRGEALKRVVVDVQAQINNILWRVAHVRFLQDFAHYLRPRYLVDDSTVEECYRLMAVHGLDRFRGSVSAPEVLKRYRIEEVKSE